MFLPIISAFQELHVISSELLPPPSYPKEMQKYSNQMVSSMPRMCKGQTVLIDLTFAVIVFVLVFLTLNTFYAEKISLHNNSAEISEMAFLANNASRELEDHLHGDEPGYVSESVVIREFTAIMDRYFPNASPSSLLHEIFLDIASSPPK